jgi:hypothetical protein
VALVNIMLRCVDHWCCGPRRRVGDTVTMHIHNSQGQVYEERHPDSVSIATQAMTGTIVGMEWRPAIMREKPQPEDYMYKTLQGYGPGRMIESTEYDDPDPDNDDWVFQFTVDTDDPIPAPAS